MNQMTLAVSGSTTSHVPLGKSSNLYFLPRKPNTTDRAGMSIKRDNVRESILLKSGTMLRTSFISAAFHHKETPGTM